MILRVCQNFGPCELHLVRPQRPSMLVHPEFEQMSHGAEEARDAIRVTESIEESLSDCEWAVGFTARVRGHRKRVDWRTLAPDVVERGDAPDQRLALVFGNEVTGLTAEEAGLCHDLSHVRTSEAHTSLNLGMSVAVALSALYTGREVHQREPGGSLLNGEGREFLKARLKEVFADKIARTDAAAKDVRESIERVFSRAPLENKDARAWHLVLKTLGSKMSPVDLGLFPKVKEGRRREALEKAKEKGKGNETTGGE